MEGILSETYGLPGGTSAGDCLVVAKKLADFTQGES